MSYLYFRVEDSRLKLKDRDQGLLYSLPLSNDLHDAILGRSNRYAAAWLTSMKKPAYLRQKRDLSPIVWRRAKNLGFRGTTEIGKIEVTGGLNTHEILNEDRRLKYLGHDLIFSSIDEAKLLAEAVVEVSLPSGVHWSNENWGTITDLDELSCQFVSYLNL